MTNLTRFEKNKTEFILCDCGSEILLIDYDNDLKLADFCIFKFRPDVLSFWQRMRYIFRILIYGKPYSDQMVLTDNQLKQLRDYLDNLI
jgi:hypothetical protein